MIESWLGRVQDRVAGAGRAVLAAAVLVASVTGAGGVRRANAADPSATSVTELSEPAPITTIVGGAAGPQAIEEVSLEQLLGTVVGVSKREERAAEAPATITIITRYEFERFGWRSVAEALRSVPGLYVSSSRSHSVLGIRALSLPGDVNTRVLVLLDGHVMNNAWSGASSLDELLSVPPAAIERVEVIRGPSSSIYGSNAFFAVVNIVTSGARADQPTRAQLELLAGSVGTYRVSVAGHRRLGRDVELQGFAVAVAGDGPAITFEDMTRPRESSPAPLPNGPTTEGTDFERGYNLGGTARWRWLRLQAQWADRAKGLPSAPNDSIFGDEYNSVHDRHWLVELRAERGFGQHTALVRLYYDHLRSREYAHRDPTDWVAGSFLSDDPHVVLDGRDGGMGGEAQVTLALGAHDLLSVGADVSHHQVLQQTYELATVDTGAAGVVLGEPLPGTIRGGILDENGEVPAIGFWNVGFYAQNTLTLGRNLSVVAGARLDANTIFGEDAADVFGGFAPRLAIVHQPRPDLTVKLLYGEAFRNPTVYEAYFDDSASVCGNPDVRPEQQRTIELSVGDRVRRDLDASFSVYAYEIEDLLGLESIDSCYVGSGSRLHYVNEGRAWVAGAEAGLRLHMERGLDGFASLGGWWTWRDQPDANAEDATGDRLPNSPHLVGSVGLSLPITSRISIMATAAYVSERLAWTLDETHPERPYLKVDAGFIGRRLIGGLRASLRVTNALDLEWRDPVSSQETIATAIPQDGIAVYGTVGHEW